MNDIDSSKLDALLTRAAQEVDDGLLPSCQLAVGYEGEVVVSEAFGGDAHPDTRYVAFSCTKGFVAATVWRLMADGLIDVERRVAEYLPEFASNGKDQVTVEQVMLHTSGFPQAPLGPPLWETSAGRRKAFAAWRLNWEPGTRFEYHPTSAHWVLAEIIQEVTGQDYRDVVEQQVTEPLGLPRVLGIAEDAQDGIAPVVAVGDPVPAEEWEALGLPDITAYLNPEVSTPSLVLLDQPGRKAVGVPGGGGVMRAVDLARFYQALLHNPGQLWPPDLLADVTGRVRNELPDFLGASANRSLGLILAGDDGKSNMRGFGRTTSPGAFGHNGAGGQIAFADPATGLSFAYLTNGLDQNLIRQSRRDTAIASRAATLLSD